MRFKTDAIDIQNHSTCNHKLFIRVRKLFLSFNSIIWVGIDFWFWCGANLGCKNFGLSKSYIPANFAFNRGKLNTSVLLIRNGLSLIHNLHLFQMLNWWEFEISDNILRITFPFAKTRVLAISHKNWFRVWWVYGPWCRKSVNCSVHIVLIKRVLNRAIILDKYFECWHHGLKRVFFNSCILRYESWHFNLTWLDHNQTQPMFNILNNCIWSLVNFLLINLLMFLSILLAKSDAPFCTTTHHRLHLTLLTVLISELILKLLYLTNGQGDHWYLFWCCLTSVSFHHWLIQRRLPFHQVISWAKHIIMM